MKEETINILNRLRIGHTFIIYNHVMSNKDALICETCGVAAYTVKHIIITKRKNTKIFEKKHHISQHIGETLGLQTYNQLPTLYNF